MSTNIPPITAPKPKRYHPALVALHWIVFVLIFATAFLAGGGEGGGEGGGLSIGGFPPIGIHMIFGIIVLVLLVVRLAIRWRSQRPAWATAGNAFLDKIGELTHWALYFFTFAITITGIILASRGDRLLTTFGLASSTPGQFSGAFARGSFLSQLGRFHGLSWSLLFLLILLHVGAALYHQFIMKDNLLSRMWFGKQYE